VPPVRLRPRRAVAAVCISSSRRPTGAPTSACRRAGSAPVAGARRVRVAAPPPPQGRRARTSLLKRAPLAQAELRLLREDIAPTWLRPPLSVEATAERYVRPQLRQARRMAPWRCSLAQVCPPLASTSTAGWAAPRGCGQLRPLQPCCLSAAACERMAGSAARRARGSARAACNELAA